MGNDDPFESFLQALHDAGIGPADRASIRPDRGICRYRVEGDRVGTRNGWAVFHSDFPPSGIAKSYKTGVEVKWSAPSARPLTEQERRALQDRIEQDRKSAQVLREASYQKAAERARREWEQAAPASLDHPYLAAKGTKPHGLRQDRDGRLLVPLCGPDATLWSLQRIGRDGQKGFLPGGRVAGACWTVQTGSGPVIVAEGAATAASIAEAVPGATVVAAMSAGNLEHIARDHRSKHPSAQIILGGDDDTLTAGNPGRTKAEAAAQAVGGVAIFPPGGGDWNDYHRAHGLEAVAKEFTGAKRQPFFERIGDLLAEPKPVDWLIKGYLERGTVAVLLGQPGRGKTYLALDWACHVATGRDWCEQRTRQAPALLIAGEGQQAVIRRAAAWHTVHGGLHDAPLHISRGAVALNSDAFEQVMAEIAQMPEKPGLVIIDTVARCLSGDENAPEPMGGFVKALDRLRDETGATILALHHPGKADPTDPRGHSSLRGAIDALFLLEGREGGVALVNTKQRGGQPAPAKFFRFRQVGLPEGWRDPEMPLVGVFDAVLEASDPLADPADDPTKGLKDSQRLALAVLKRLEAEHQRNLATGGRDPEKARVSLKDWRDAAKEEEIATKHFSRIRKSLEERGLVGSDGTFVWSIDPKTPNTPNGAFGDNPPTPNTPHVLDMGDLGNGSGSVPSGEEEEMIEEVLI